MGTGSGERRRPSHARTVHYISDIRRAIVAGFEVPDVPFDAGGTSAYSSPNKTRRLCGRNPPPDTFPSAASCSCLRLIRRDLSSDSRRAIAPSIRAHD